jgi:glycosyltransferase involved in cell wall biosynthesis
MKKWDNNDSRTLIVIPAYNEQANIGNVVRDALQLENADVLVVDDGSKDYTIDVASRYGARVLALPYNLGIGGAVQAGLKYAVVMGYSYVLRLDGDGQHVLDEGRKLLQAVQNRDVDIAIGSRFVPNSKTYDPSFSRALGIRWFAFMIRTITRQAAYDTTSGMQAMNRAAFTFLANYYPQDYPEVEARILIYKANLKTAEFPVQMSLRMHGNSSITFLRSIYYLFKVSLATLMTAFRQLSLSH